MTPGTTPVRRRRRLARVPKASRGCADTCADWVAIVTPRSEFAISTPAARRLRPPITCGYVFLKKLADGLIVMNPVDCLTKQLCDAEHHQSILDGVTAVTDRYGIRNRQFCEILCRQPLQ